MATAKRKSVSRRTRKSQGVRTASGTRTAEAAVRSVIPDDVLRNLESQIRRVSTDRADPRVTASRFAC